MNRHASLLLLFIFYLFLSALLNTTPIHSKESSLQTSQNFQSFSYPKISQKFYDSLLKESPPSLFNPYSKNENDDNMHDVNSHHQRHQHHHDVCDLVNKQKAWVFFTDKGNQVLGGDVKHRILKSLSHQSIQRRMNQHSTNHGEMIDVHDLPVFREYIEGVKEVLNVHDCFKTKSMRIWTVSNWLNAISVKYTSKEEIEKIAKLPYVQFIEKVATYKRERDTNPMKHEDSSKSINIHKQGFNNKVNGMHGVTGIDYGISWSQLFQIDVPKVHQMGYKGQNVTIMIMDSGFRVSHVSLSSLKIIDKFDFVNNDTNVDYEPGDLSDQHYHGTKCLGAIAAYMPTEYVGTAFEASFLLAKTEDTKSESLVEEDNIVRALEWGEKKGAHVASISLGYTDWYESHQFDGKTAISTKAINIAIEKGLTCVIAAGNAGLNGIGAPGDAFFSITVGAVDYSDKIGRFSSVGPSSDGRIKPEVCARGALADLINPNSDSGYHKASGTSFSTPMVAGVVALILSANPQLGPKQVRDILIKTVRRPKTFNDRLPNNYYGWGIVNATAAVLLGFNYPKGCNGNCNGNGICKYQVCECFFNFHGVFCEEERIHCNITTCRNGFCRDNICECFRDFTGPMCSINKNGASNSVNSLNVLSIFLMICIILISFLLSGIDWK